MSSEAGLGSTATFRIAVESCSFEASEGDLVTGLLHCSLGAVDFPDSQWDDFVVVVLGWWCIAVFELLQDNSYETELLFMDGPYLIAVERLPHGQLNMRLVKRGRGDDTDIAVGESSIHELRDAVVSASLTTLAYCESRSVGGRDVEALRKGAADLSQVELE